MVAVALRFFSRGYSINAEMGIFFFARSFRCASLVWPCHSLPERLELCGQQCAVKGSTQGGATSMYADGGLQLGGGGCSLFPGSFCLSHSPLMRVNEDKSV